MKKLIQNKSVCCMLVLIFAVLILVAVHFTAERTTYTQASEYDSNIANGNLAMYNEGYLYLNLTDGIHRNDIGLKNDVKITDGVAFYPTILGNKLFYVAADGEDNSIRRVDLVTGENEVIYHGNNVYFLARCGEDMVILDEDDIIRLKSDGTYQKLKHIRDISQSFVYFSNDEFMLFYSNDNKRIKLYDFCKGRVKTIYDAGDEHLNGKPVSDGKYVYFVVRDDSDNGNLARLQIGSAHAEILLNFDYGAGYAISDSVCYYLATNSGSGNFVCSFDLNTYENKKLFQSDCDVMVDMNIVGNYIVFRPTSGYKRLQLTDISTGHNTDGGRWIEGLSFDETE